MVTVYLYFVGVHYLEFKYPNSLMQIEAEIRDWIRTFIQRFFLRGKRWESSEPDVRIHFPLAVEFFEIFNQFTELFTSFV